MLAESVLQFYELPGRGFMAPAGGRENVLRISVFNGNLRGRVNFRVPQGI